MMDTILNLGLNDETEAGLARGVRRCGVRAPTACDGSASSTAPSWVRRRRRTRGTSYGARSRPCSGPGTSERARAYRQAEGIPDDLGTGVTVQAMVFGNLGADSGTGVLFTRNPATGEAELYGDVLFDAQGEDVVAGTHATEPVSGARGTDAGDIRRPARHAATLERHFRDCCDIEFTIEAGRLWLLQIRVGKRTPQAALRMAVEMAEDPAFPLSREEAVRRVLPLLASRRWPRWTGAIGPRRSPGGSGPRPAWSGEIRLTSAAAVGGRRRGPDVILVRPETSPDDIAGMDRARGILTRDRRVRESRRRRRARLGHARGRRGGRGRRRRRRGARSASGRSRRAR